MSDRQNHSSVAPVTEIRPGRHRAEWVARAQLALSLTVGSLIAIAALKFALSIDSALRGVLGLIVTVGVVAVGLVLGLAAGCLLAATLLKDDFAGVPAPLGLAGRPRRLKMFGAVAGMIVIDAAAMWALAAVLPFRFGLLSCLYFCLPAVLLAWLAAPRSRRRLLFLCTVLAAGVALALPARALQIDIAAQQWLNNSGVSGRAQAQVVILPGLAQEPYTFDGTTLIARFDTVQDGLTSWSAVERVTAGKADPCAAILVADGDGDETDSLSCVQVTPGLWLRGGQLGQGTGYVLERNGLTITVTESWADVDTTALRQEILAAHPASDAELWPREGSTRYSLAGLLLL